MPLQLVRVVDWVRCEALAVRLLSGIEREHLSRYRNSSRASEYVTSRILVKLLASRWLGLQFIPPVDLEFYGPPATAPKLYLRQQHLSHLHVSISHSNGLVFAGLRDHEPIGVDIEHCSGRDWESIFAFMQWPLPESSVSFSLSRACCCSWTIYEAGFKLYAGLIGQSDFRIISMNRQADDSMVNRMGFTFVAAFGDRVFTGSGISSIDWSIAVAVNQAAQGTAQLNCPDPPTHTADLWSSRCF